jgi:hypothetical protein
MKCLVACNLRKDIVTISCADCTEPMKLILKITAFWVMAPCSLVEVERHFRVRTASMAYRLDDGGSTHL